MLPPEAQVSGRGTLIVDSDGDFLPDNAPQSLVDDIVAAGLNPDDYITADAGSPSGYVLLNPIAAQFPGGYNPDFGADISDTAVVLGARGDTAGGWSWNVNGRFATSEADYVLGESINPSLGRLSPTDFKPGKLEQEESGLRVDFVVPVEVGNLASPLNFAFGAEWREEVYTITQGDPASIEVGPTVAQFGVGSDGFQGFPVASAGEFDIASVAGYVDVEADFTDRFTAGAAIRAEDYDEFGNTFDWKLSGRFEITETAAIRGTVSTGFRAPTPGQVNTLNVTTSSDSAGNLIPFGTYPVSNPIAIALGSQPLDPEESTSFSFGAVFSPTDNTSITIDYYNIEIEERLTILENEIGPAEVQLLEDAGIENASLLLNSTANFFVNGFTSDIQGVDLSITTTFDTGIGSLLVDFRHNWNEQEVKDVTPNTLNTSTVFDFENQVPQNRTVITADLDTGGMFSGFVRLSYFDEWGDSGGQIAAPDASEAVTYGSEFLLDLEARFQLTEWFYVTVGGENVLDTVPDDDQHFVAELLGVDKSLTSPFGVNGGFWYVRLGADF